MRLVVVLVVLVALGGPAVPATARPGGRADVVEALGVLHDWDTRRARAWARGDQRGLRSLYLPGAAARADVRLLRSYTARGLVVRRLVTQVFGVRVLRRDGTTIVIRVLDRVAGGQVRNGHRVMALPSSRPALRLIELRRVAGTWKVATVER